MKTTKLAVALGGGVALIGLCVVAQSQDAHTWESRATGVRDESGASEWWMSTWRTGDRVTMTAQYGITGTMCIFTKNKDQVKWYDLKGRFLEADHRVDIQGTSKSTTHVLLGNGPKGEPLPEKMAVQLLRSYECPMSTRGAAVIGLKNGLEHEARLRNAYIKFYENSQSPAVQRLWEERMKRARTWTKGFVTPLLIKLSFVPGFHWAAAMIPVAPFAVDWAYDSGEAFASRKGEELYKSSLERISSDTFKEGGVEAKKDSCLYFNFESDEVKEATNFAMQFNDLFTGRDFYISTKSGDVPFAKQLIWGEAAWKCLQACQDFTSLPDKMMDLPVTPNEVKVADVITRETLNVNAKLFDARKRKVGDVWRVNADLLNNFLHQDLTGAFSGQMFVKYVEDKDITLNSAGPTDKKDYHTRHLKMEKRYMGVSSKISYVEPGDFKMTYSAEEEGTTAAVDLYVDIKSGYIVKVGVQLDGSVEILPNLMLTRGWGFKNGEGRLAVTVTAESVPSHELAQIMKAK